MAVKNRISTARARSADDLVQIMRDTALPLHDPNHLDPLLNLIGDARLVLLGEASHGTSEYYSWRAALSQRLILEKGFSFLAVEGDWPDCYQINRFIKRDGDTAESAREVLGTFTRWPTWMWANEEIVELAEWLRRHNDNQPREKRVGFYGLDVYSLWDSLYAVMGYLQENDASALPAAWRALRCFEPFGEDAQEYARATAAFVPRTCEDQVVRLLAQLRHRAPTLPTEDRHETHFQAEQNALVVKNAEAYYRAMVHGGPESWNIRDRHMADTLDRLMQHHGPEAKAIIWEHNTHIGDARFTDMRSEGMFNLGQLARERHHAEGVVLVGFGSYQGSVIDGRRWGAPWQPLEVPPATAGSWEDILHQAGSSDKLFLFDGPEVNPLLLERRGHRAIGVVYHPEYEHYGNYVPTVLPRRYDAFLYLDQTRALRPLPEAIPKMEEVPETYPSGV
jgi:erythromycin esterase